MSTVWDEFVTTGGGHGVELYASLEELGESVAAFFADGSRCVLVATPDQRRAVEPLLDPRLEVVAADAGETLAKLLDRDGWVSRTAFAREINGLLDAAGPSPRVFGSMVDLLAARGDREAAEALEALWNGLLRQRDFSLLCAYSVDVFDLDAQASLVPAICHSHSHVVPAHDETRFTQAVDHALTEVLGTARARDVRYIVERSLPARRVPAAQDALRWVTANLPAKAPDVLAAARAAYAG